MPDTFIITRLGRHGDGVAPGPIFVPRALPGEVVEGDLAGDILEKMRIVTPSGDRVAPHCKHFKTCGGCQLQHASDALLSTWKRELICHALGSEGIDTDVRQTLTSPPRSRRRAKFAARRTKSGAMAGFRGRRDNTIVDISDCPLISPALQVGPDIARALAALGASRKSELSVQVTETQTGLDVDVTGGKPLDADLLRSLPSVIQTFEVCRLTWDDELVAQTTLPKLTLGPATVAVPPGAFLQATKHGQQALQACVLEALKGAGATLDLFAGCGTFALTLAQTRAVHAVEGDATMLHALQDAANKSSATYPITSAVRDLFEDPLNAQELSKFDALVLDPPRAGARAQVQQICAAQVPRLAYVSCEPVSFARDAALLCAAGYCLEWVQPVDQFRWSSHVELAARFSLPHMLGA